jgi:hypothetical protein
VARSTGAGKAWKDDNDDPDWKQVLDLPHIILFHGFTIRLGNGKPIRK